MRKMSPERKKGGERKKGEILARKKNVVEVKRDQIRDKRFRL